MKKNIEHPFTIGLEGQLVDCMIHSIELRPKDEVGWDEEKGYMKITIGDREPFEYAIWGAADDELEACYVCLPTMIEDSDDDELENYSMDIMLQGIDLN